MENEKIELIKQPVEAVGWKKTAVITVERKERSGNKLFWPIVSENMDTAKAGFPVAARSIALRHAFDYCNAHRLKVISVSGVRPDKFILW